MKNKEKIHLYILTTLVIVSSGLIPAAIIGLIVPLDWYINWFGSKMPINMFVMTFAVFFMSFFRKEIYRKMSLYIYGIDYSSKK